MERYTGLRCGEKKKTILELSYWFESGKQKKKKKVRTATLETSEKKKKNMAWKKRKRMGIPKRKKKQPSRRCFLKSYCYTSSCDMEF